MTDEEKKLLVKLLERDEGYEQFPYDDLTGKAVFAPVGKISIGIGINLEETGIDHDEAVYLLLNRLAKFEKNLLTFHFFERLDIVRRYVLFNMCFNLGFNGLCKFKNMLAAIDSKDYHRASVEILDSKAARELSARYARLAKMMDTGMIFK